VRSESHSQLIAVADSDWLK
jgi:hypothetical protein